jgi:hypothetical protein
VVAGGTGYGVVTEVAGAPPKKPQVVRAAAPSASSGAPAVGPIRATRAGVRRTPSVAHPRNKPASTAAKRTGKAYRLKKGLLMRRGRIHAVRVRGEARPHLASPAASRPKAKVKAPHAPTRPPRGKKPNLPRRGGPKPQEEKEHAAKTKPPPAAGLPGRAR